MDYLSTHSSLTDVLHALSQGLLVPDIILLLLFAAYALFCIGSVLMEYFTERRNFKVAMPKFLSALMAAHEDEIPEIVRTSGLLNRQKSALLTVFDYRSLPGDALLALIRRTVHGEETRYGRITERNNTAAKVSPMLGLMGTLIPLGPGVAALGQADPTVLSSSLLVAFDTTVAGLAVAAVCMVVGKIRSNWYADYLSALDSSMATMLQKIEDLRAAGSIQSQEPTNYAFMFEQGLKKPSAAKTAPARETEERAEAEEEPGQSSAVTGDADEAPAVESSAALRPSVTPAQSAPERFGQAGALASEVHGTGDTRMGSRPAALGAHGAFASQLGSSGGGSAAGNAGNGRAADEAGRAADEAGSASEGQASHV